MSLSEKKFCKIHSPFELYLCDEHNNDCAWAYNESDVLLALKELEEFVNENHKSCEGFCVCHRIINEIKGLLGGDKKIIKAVGD